MTVSSAPVTVHVERGHFEWLTGEDCTAPYDLLAARSFATTSCRTCGSPLPHHTRSGRTVVVPAGSFGAIRGSPVDLIRQAPRMRNRFTQVNVFSTAPLGGNPLAVVHAAARLSEVQTAALARWTNLQMKQPSASSRDTRDPAPNRTHCGKPRMTLISFCAMRVLSRLTGLLKG